MSSHRISSMQMDYTPTKARVEHLAWLATQLDEARHDYAVLRRLQSLSMTPEAYNDVLESQEAVGNHYKEELKGALNGEEI